MPHSQTPTSSVPPLRPRTPSASRPTPRLTRRAFVALSTGAAAALSGCLGLAEVHEARAAGENGASGGTGASGDGSGGGSGSGDGDGHDDHTHADGGDIDVAVVGDVVPGSTVTVLASHDDDPLADAVVFRRDADGSERRLGRTDADGRLDVHVPDDGALSLRLAFESLEGEYEAGSGGTEHTHTDESTEHSHTDDEPTDHTRTEAEPTEHDHAGDEHTDHDHALR